MARAVEGIVPVEVIAIEEAIDLGIQLTRRKEDTRISTLSRATLREMIDPIGVLTIVGVDTTIGIVLQRLISLEGCDRTELFISLILIALVIAERIVPLLPAHLVVVHGTDLIVLREPTHGEALARREGKVRLTSLPSIPLRGDEDDPITCAGAVEGGGGSVLQHRDISDILLSDIRDTPRIDSAIDDVQRSRGGIDRAEATDTDICFGARLTR